jgi:hypothetical protein
MNANTIPSVVVVYTGVSGGSVAVFSTNDRPMTTERRLERMPTVVTWATPPPMTGTANPILARAPLRAAVAERGWDVEMGGVRRLDFDS